ncbi:MAG TPA: cation:proton antiporter [Armatimonadota bacterium]|nr:cation:proton antiporter [Armatimonadota bacterium]
MRKRSRGLLLGILLGLFLAHLWAPASGQPPAPMPPPTNQAPHAAPASGAAPAQALPTGAHASTDHGTMVKDLLVGLLIILVGAKLGGALFERVGQPAVLGEILVGIFLGNLGLIRFGGLDFLRGNTALIALSELGVILLLFEVGLESNIHEMRRVGLSSFIVAVLGVVTPAALGWAVGRLFLPHENPLVHVFIGATLCATSVGITARVLRDLGQLQRPEARIVLGAAVLDDVMGLVVLAVVSGIIRAAAGGGALSVESILLIVVKAVAFLVGAIALGTFFSPRLFRMASFLNVQHMLLVTSLGLCFLLARIAAEIELAPIVGAFAAGLILDPVHYQDFQDRGEHTIEELIHPISGFLVPVFFVVTGMSVDLRALADPNILGFAGVLTLMAILGKQACSLGVTERGLDRLSVGIGMIPRGEVGLIFANIGLGLRIIEPDGQSRSVVSASTFSAVVFMVMVTTLITPPLLKWSLSRKTTSQAPPQ